MSLAYSFLPLASETVIAIGSVTWVGPVFLSRDDRRDAVGVLHERRVLHLDVGVGLADRQALLLGDAVSRLGLRLALFSGVVSTPRQPLRHGPARASASDEQAGARAHPNAPRT